MLRAAYVYANPRGALAEAVVRGDAPDTGLLGQNHLGELGIDARIHEPALRRRERARGLRHRLTWNARELTLPWELRDADVVCTPLAGLLPLAARLRRRPRVVVLNISLCTTFDRSSRARQRLLSASLRSAARIVCFASAQRERLLEQTGLPPERVETVVLGLDERFYRPAGPPAADGYVLAVGRDLARDYATFARAVDGLGRRTVLVASARNLEGLTLPRNVETRIDVGYGELRELYAGAGCVVVPTRREDFPLGADCSGQTVLLDAMAMGRPVVLSERSTLADYVRPGVTAVTVPPEEPRVLRDALERVLGDNALAAELGAAGRRLVEERHTTRQLAAALAPLLRAAAV
ncbi:MAG: glycosyltransferase family 4 protein [Actinobacteria bacterium]|nr:glycosyltransferase family 4 protein [Actinomycetota bacterium]